jgi:hypothetical protein
MEFVAQPQNLKDTHYWLYVAAYSTYATRYCVVSALRVSLKHIFDSYIHFVLLIHIKVCFFCLYDWAEANQNNAMQHGGECGVDQP